MRYLTITKVYNVQERLILSQQFAKMADNSTLDKLNSSKITNYIRKIQLIVGKHNVHFYRGLACLLKDASYPIFTSIEDIQLLLALQNEYFPKNDGLQNLLYVTEKLVGGQASSFYDTLIDYFGDFQPTNLPTWRALLHLLIYDKNPPLAFETWCTFYRRYSVILPIEEHACITRSQYLVFQRLLSTDYVYSELAARTMVKLIQICLPNKGNIEGLADYLQYFLQEILPLFVDKLGYEFLEVTPYGIIDDLFEFWVAYSHQSKTRKAHPLLVYKALVIEYSYNHYYCPYEDDLPADEMTFKVNAYDLQANAYYLKLYTEHTSYLDSVKDEYIFYYPQRHIKKQGIEPSFCLDKYNYEIGINACQVWEGKRSYYKEGSWVALNIITASFQKVIQYLPKIILSNIRSVSVEVLNHLSNGQNIRKVEPYTFMTKKMAHIYTNLEGDDEGFQYSLLLALIISLGGKIDDYYFYVEFFTERFFSPNSVQGFRDKLPMLLDVLPKIIEWRAEIEQMEYENRQIICGFLSHIHRDLRGYQFKGRTLASFFRQAEVFNEVNISNFSYGVKNVKWQGANYQAFNSTLDDTHYMIIQLTNLRALQEESRAMNHCVKSYSSRCMYQGTSIWSLRKKTDEGTEKPIATIEVNKSRKIVQAKAKYNAKPDEMALKMINSWAAQAGLSYQER